MKTYGGVAVWMHVFLILVLVGGEWSASRPGRYTPKERAPGTHWVGGWVGPRAGLDIVEKRKFLTLQGLKIRHLGHSACSLSQSLLTLLRLCSSLNVRGQVSHPYRPLGKIGVFFLCSNLKVFR
jgi:hypothetical protein